MTMLKTQKNVDEFIATLKTLRWMQPDGNPLPEWKVFPTRGKAILSAQQNPATRWNIAYHSANNVVWDNKHFPTTNKIWHSIVSKARHDIILKKIQSDNLTYGEVYNTVYDASYDAALSACLIYLGDLGIEQKHYDTMVRRMQVWEKGYGLYAEVDGVLYVYERV